MDPSPFILDGGLATELEASGFQLQGDPLWSARILHSNPQAIKDVHYRYLQSGSDVITTATYQASIEGFVKYLDLRPEEAQQMIMSGVQLAKETVREFMSHSTVSDRREPVVAGSVGPYGAFLHDGSEYTGAYEDKMTVEVMQDEALCPPKPPPHKNLKCIQCLVKADLVAMETIPSLKEAEALVEVLREFPEAKTWLSFSCKDIQNISSGRFSEAVQVACRSSQLVAVGVNCCPAPLVKPLLESAKSLKKADLSWVVYPNSGEEWDPKTGWKTKKRTSFAKPSLDWKEQGALWIGGCCRVGPADITELKEHLHV
ncbi:homocysteine S-methyltransferase YbgG-like [Sinocyclocheilus rhinocerous]|uniref:homocysteine S-methyltransferase YbgG-like n=1 Tax=Sinocyclocheilus rhinocerous TaxID=307959 RepID=UPI0007BA17B8|nr:PREDICTED: homocysteine S-methyltransferase YbgG-like [Sinocyclocheilus rhinocerous]